MKKEDIKNIEEIITKLEYKIMEPGWSGGTKNAYQRGVKTTLMILEKYLDKDIAAIDDNFIELIKINSKKYINRFWEIYEYENKVKAEIF